MLKNIVFNSLSRLLKPQFNQQSNLIHTTCALNKKWGLYNKKVFPPQSPDEPPRQAYVCHVKRNLKYSYKKLWYIACFVRGMTVDEALKQLEFINKKGAIMVRDTILEAQQLAINEHNVEFKSNLWVSESFVGRAMIIKGLRRCARGRMTRIRYRYTHYFVTLEEGTPPKDYYYFKRKKSGEELLNEWLQQMRNRKIIGSL